MAILVVTYDSATGGFRTQKIGSAQISDGAIVSAKIGALAVGTPHIAANAITSGKVAANAITSGEIASGGLSPLTSGKIWAGFTGNIPREEDKPAAVPSGLIAMWHGTIANIPAGWVICDGNNSTPNLLTRFVEGVATAATDPGATGGATSKTIPTHKLTVSEIPAHKHDITISWNDAHAKYAYIGTINPSLYSDTGDFGVQNTGGGGSHGHGSISDIRPKYYDVAFIMKT